MVRLQGLQLSRPTCPNLAEAQRAQVERIRDAAQYQVALIEDILDFAALEGTGTRQLEATVIGVEEALARTESILDPARSAAHWPGAGAALRPASHPALASLMQPLMAYPKHHGGSPMKVMQKLKGVLATLPAQDINRAKMWYSDRLGLQPVEERPDGLVYRIGDGYLFLYPSQYAGTNAATAASFAVDDVRETVDGLRTSGIRFEEFDLPNTTWEDGVATAHFDGDEYRGAWFKDSEGNILAVGDFPIG